MRKVWPQTDKELDMDVFEALFTRRSIRKFTDEPVSDADLQLVL